jgi:hypothetical protein
MARLPTSLGDAPVEGQAPSTDVVQPTDFGFGQAGGEFERVAMMSRRVGLMDARAQAAQDRTAAAMSPQFQAAQEADDSRFGQEAGAWNGSPGFATDQIAKTKAAYATAAAAFQKAGATPGQLAEFNTLSTQATLRRAGAANEFEQRRALEQADEVQATTVNGFKGQMIAAWAPARQTLLDGYDGSTPTLIPQTGQAFDQAVAPILDSAPEGLKPKLQLEASLMRAEAIAQAGELQGHAQNAYVLTQTGDQAQTLINSVYSNPAAYDDVSQQLPAIAAQVPGEYRAATLDRWRSANAQARVSGLIDRQQYGQALSELDDGRYDGFLEKGAKGELEARALAENRAHGPEAVDHAVAAQKAAEDAQADAYARATTGHGTGFNYDAAAASLMMTPDQAAAAKIRAQRADEAFAAAGSVHDWNPTQLQAAVTSAAPDPASPGYTDKLFIWQTQRDAAQAELAARAKGAGAWAFNAGPAPAKGKPGAADAQDRGAILQGKWQTLLTAPPDQRLVAGGDYAGYMLGTQAKSGIAPAQMQIVPQAEAGQLAASVANAAPEQRLGAFSNIAGILSALPPQISLPGVGTVSPRGLLIDQLRAAKMTPMEISAIVDSDGDPAKVGRFVAALNDPSTKSAATGSKQAGELTNTVRNALAPYLATTTSPADQALNQGRIDRITLEARYLMGTQHLSARDAAIAAAQDFNGAYTFQHGWRMPKQAADQSVATVGNVLGVPFGVSSMRGDQAADLGSSRILAGLLAGNGAGIYADPTTQGTIAQRQQMTADKVAKSAAWRTLPDESGLQLVMPKPDGTWSTVADKWGRPITASWSQLQGVAAGAPSPFAAPPANQPKAPDGQPLRGFSSADGFNATVWAVTGQESRFKTGAVGPQTRYGQALGIMQVMPQFAEPYAQKLFGAPLDVHRLQWDDDYNRKIGSAMLGDYVKRYGNTGPGLALAIAAYNAGPGNVEGYRDARGYHPGLLQRLGDPRQPGGPSLNSWIPRVDIKETRDYLEAVLPAALKHLQGAP